MNGTWAPKNIHVKKVRMHFFRLFNYCRRRSIRPDNLTSIILHAASIIPFRPRARSRVTSSKSISLFLSLVRRESYISGVIICDRFGRQRENELGVEQDAGLGLTGDGSAAKHGPPGCGPLDRHRPLPLGASLRHSARGLAEGKQARETYLSFNSN